LKLGLARGDGHQADFVEKKDMVRAVSFDSDGRGVDRVFENVGDALSSCLGRSAVYGARSKTKNGNFVDYDDRTLGPNIRSGGRYDEP
jgi:hypothetical protein